MVLCYLCSIMLIYVGKIIKIIIKSNLFKILYVYFMFEICINFLRISEKKINSFFGILIGIL